MRRRTVCVLNSKGGTGKTTTAVNLAAALGERGDRVLLIDLDPQGSASDALGVPHHTDPGTDIRDVLTGDVEPRALCEILCETSASNVSVVPASARLESLTVADTLGPGRTKTPYLREALGQLSNGRAGWSYVVLDTPPTIGALSLAALAAATEALIPLPPSPASLPGLRTALGAVHRVRDTVNPDLAFTGAVLCRLRRTLLSKTIAAQLRKQLRERLFKTVIRESVRVEEAHGWGLPVLLHDPAGEAAEDFRALAEEFVQRTPGHDVQVA